MVQSRQNKHVWYVFPGSLSGRGESMVGGWYYVDETEDFGGGPYLTEREAIDQLNKYAAWLNQEVEDDFTRELTNGII